MALCSRRSSTRRCLMFRRSNSSGDGGRERPGREQPGLGPFSSAQLTLIVVTLAIVVGFPFAAAAVTGNNVFVTDPSTGTRATVNGAGQLAVNATPTPPAQSYNTTWRYVFDSDSCDSLTPTVP